MTFAEVAQAEAGRSLPSIAAQIQDAVARCMQWGVRPDEIFLGSDERNQLVELSKTTLVNANVPVHGEICDGQSRYRGMIVRFLVGPGVRVGATFHGDKSTQPAPTTAATGGNAQ